MLLSIASAHRLAAPRLLDGTASWRNLPRLDTTPEHKCCFSLIPGHIRHAAAVLPCRHHCRSWRITIQWVSAAAAATEPAPLLQRRAWQCADSTGGLAFGRNVNNGAAAREAGAAEIRQAIIWETKYKAAHAFQRTLGKRRARFVHSGGCGASGSRRCGAVTGRLPPCIYTTAAQIEPLSMVPGARRYSGMNLLADDVPWATVLAAAWVKTGAATVGGCCCGLKPLNSAGWKPRTRAFACDGRGRDLTAAAAAAVVRHCRIR